MLAPAFVRTETSSKTYGSNMTVEVKLGFTGLNTAPNLLSTSGTGSLTIADNATIDELDLVRPRRGFERATPSPFPNTFRRSKRIFSFGERLYTLLDNDELLALDGADWRAYYEIAGETTAGNFTPFADGDTFQFNNLLYMTTTLGLHYKASGDDLFVSAQLPGGGTLIAELVADPAGFMADDRAVAYRAVVERTLPNGSLLIGAPTARVLKTRTADGLGNQNVTLSMGMNNLFVVGDVVRFFRSRQFVVPAVPGDELQEVGEVVVTQPMIDAGLITFTDSTPDDERGATIYTASSQQGLVNQNGNIPSGRTAAVYDNTTFLGNTRGHSFQTITLEEQPAVSETVTLLGSVFTAFGNNDVPFRRFEIGATLEETAGNLAFIAQRFFQGGVTFTANGASITIQETRAGENDTGFDLVLGSKFTTTGFKPFTSEANVLYYSKSQQPSHFPAPQFLRIGQGSILKVVSLREALLVFTTDGTYRISGFNPDYTVERIDNSAILLSPASCKVLNNQVYCLTVQGVAVVNSAGVEIISAPVWDKLKSLILTKPDRLADISIGISDEIRGRYYLGLPDDDSATVRTLLIYQANTRAWVSWDISCTCGELIENSLHLGAADFANVLKQKVNYDRFDFSDQLYSLNAIDKTGFVDADGREYAAFTIPSGIGRVMEGDLLKFSASDWYKVRRVFPETKTVVLNQLLVNVDYGDTLVDLHSQIFVTLKYTPIMSGTPADMKQWRRGLVYFKNGIRDTGTITVTTDVTRTPYTHPLIGIRSIPWGTFPWGDEPWGGGGAITEAIRMRGIKGGQLFLTMRLGSIFNSYELQGVALEARQAPTMRFRKQ